MPSCRLLDLGPLPAAQNMALDWVLLKTCGRDRISPPTLRFMHMARPAVLVGAYQQIATEVRLDYCRAHGIELNRRLTGGGAIYFDCSQVGIELFGRPTDLGLAPGFLTGLERLTKPIIEVLRDLGLQAAFRPRNDIEVQGRKISGTGGAGDDHGVLFQATLLTDFDAATMVRALRVPVEKLAQREMQSLCDRVTWLTRELRQPPRVPALIEHLATAYADECNLTLTPGELTEDETRLLRQALPYFASHAWLHPQRLAASSKTLYRGYASDGHSRVRASLRIDPTRGIIDSAYLSGDFFCHPSRFVYDLEHQLRNRKVLDLPALITDFINSYPYRIQGLAPETLVQAIMDAAHRTTWEAIGFDSEAGGKLLVMGGDLPDLLKLPIRTILLPYCAQKVGCQYRHSSNCPYCLGCDVGQIATLSLEAGLTPITITSFEHLMVVLSELYNLGERAVIGSCCEAFFLKHVHEMQATGMAGIFVDINSETCYDLGKAAYAYVGQYDNQTYLEQAVLQRLLELKSVQQPE